MRFYCEAYEVITEEKKVSFFYVDEKPLRYLLFDYIFLLVLAKKKYPNLMNCTPKVRQNKSNFWGAVHFA
ncbi:chlorohydrolase [Streptococcus pneumoniae]|nr:chlorohydrolase [Streptococcus pneumoniae]VSE38454.1 chlorohydrolase [Streptococcus pneumoniae]